MDGLADLGHGQKVALHRFSGDVEIAEDQVERAGIFVLDRADGNGDGFSGEFRHTVDRRLGRHDDGDGVPPQDDQRVAIEGRRQVAAHNGDIGLAVLERFGAPPQVRNGDSFKMDARMLCRGESNERRHQTIGDSALAGRDAQGGVRRPVIKRAQHSRHSQKDSGDHGQTGPQAEQSEHCGALQRLAVQ
jgi:hypothetical protein